MSSSTQSLTQNAVSMSSSTTTDGIQNEAELVIPQNVQFEAPQRAGPGGPAPTVPAAVPAVNQRKRTRKRPRDLRRNKKPGPGVPAHGGKGGQNVLKSFNYTLNPPKTTKSFLHQKPPRLQRERQKEGKKDSLRKHIDIFKEQTEDRVPADDANQIWAEYPRNTLPPPPRRMPPARPLTASEQKSILNRNATAFVPPHMKHRYDSRGELRESPPSHSKSISSKGSNPSNRSSLSNRSSHSVAAHSVSPLHSKRGHKMSTAATPTISSLYDPVDAVDAPKQYPTVHKVEDDAFYRVIGSSMQTASDSASDDASPKKWRYHVPDGILSSPPNAGRVAADYEQMNRRYPANYATSLSPSTGFAVDLSTLGYNLSPSRPQDKEAAIPLPLPLAPKTDMEFSIEHSLNAMLQDEDELLTKDLFPEPTSPSITKRERRKKKRTKDSEMVSPRLSDLF